MNSHTVVFTTVFAVMFNVMVATAQKEWDAFKFNSRKELPKYLTAILIIILCPIAFFAVALSAIGKFPNQVDLLHTIQTLYLVTPVYGFQQSWLLLAGPLRWVQVEVSALSVSAWIAFLVLFGIGPILLLIWISFCSCNVQ